MRWSSYVANDTERSFYRQRWPLYAVVQVNNVFNNPSATGKDRWIKWPKPHVIVQHYHGLTGDLLYAEAVHATR